MTDKTELLPCPFCCGEAYTVNDGRRYWTVECHDCAAHTGLYATKDFAIAAWNARAELMCRNEHGNCSICGAIMYDAPNYCQNCGARVVE